MCDNPFYLRATETAVFRFTVDYGVLYVVSNDEVHPATVIVTDENLYVLVEDREAAQLACDETLSCTSVELEKQPEGFDCRYGVKLWNEDTTVTLGLSSKHELQGMSVCLLRILQCRGAKMEAKGVKPAYLSDYFTRLGSIEATNVLRSIALMSDTSLETGRNRLDAYIKQTVAADTVASLRRFGCPVSEADIAKELERNPCPERKREALITRLAAKIMEGQAKKKLVSRLCSELQMHDIDQLHFLYDTHKGNEDLISADYLTPYRDQADAINDKHNGAFTDNLPLLAELLEDHAGKEEAAVSAWKFWHVKG